MGQGEIRVAGPLDEKCATISQSLVGRWFQERRLLPVESCLAFVSWLSDRVSYASVAETIVLQGSVLVRGGKRFHPRLQWDPVESRMRSVFPASVQPPS
jgi:hypothetical protein